MLRTGLPIEAILPQIAERCEGERLVLLQSPPGSGKSTLVPLYLAETKWASQRKIVVLQPRRIAVRSLARRMAELLGEEIGETVGYRMRFDRNVSTRTRVEIITEGILVRMLQEDAELPGVAMVIFDEFHERSLHADLALALSREAQSTLREDLRILIMSATIDSESLQERLGASVIRSDGAMHPVDVRYLAEDPKNRIWETAARETNRLVRETEGDLLVFLPGVEEIRRCEDLLEPADHKLCLLYGDLPYEKQRVALLPDPGGARKIILSTPIAETSLTIEGVRVVVDGGYAKVPRFDPSSGLTRLHTERISKDAADQRAGRAGRLGPGVCLRLWSAHTQRSLRAARTPEILESDLCSAQLELAAWGAKGRESLQWLDPPPEAAWNQARTLLRSLDAVDEEGAITATGRELVRIPAHPRLAKMVIAAKRRDEMPLACELLALLEERDIFNREKENADLDERVELLRSLRIGRGRIPRGNPGQIERVERTAREWAKRLGTNLSGAVYQDGAAGALLLHAYPERLAKRREGKEGFRYLLANGSGAALASLDRLSKSEYLVIAQMQVGSGDGRIYLAARLDENVLFEEMASKIVVERDLSWDTRENSVRAENVERIGAIALSVKRVEASGEDLERILLRQIVKAGGVALLDWSDEARQLQGRLKLAARAFPERGFPACDEQSLNAGLEKYLGPFLAGIRKLDHVRKISAESILRAQLDWKTGKELDRLFPEALDAPDGRSRKIDYSGETPVLAATVQQLFCYARTPQIAEGKIALTVHLLSPAGRPIQITTDLEGFWKGSYAEVRKEMKGRYPKHKWPEKPGKE